MPPYVFDVVHPRRTMPLNPPMTMPVENINLEYVGRICSTPEQLDWIYSQTLSEPQRRKWGFPVYDPRETGNVYIRPLDCFYNSSDPSRQTCRCGKSVSLLQEDWYKDPEGCTYHPGKRLPDGPDVGLFSCCKRQSKEDGCVHHLHHVSSFKPLEKSRFRWVEDKQNHFMDRANIFALDTEMVYTTAGLEVARVAVISITGNVLYDEYVKPQNAILDYNTAFSGIKPEDLRNVATNLTIAQKNVLMFLNKESILVGHGLENDLIGLHIVHDKIIDTSIVFGHPKGFPYRQSLKTLASMYLSSEINPPLKGHDSLEDARVCMALLLQKCYSKCSQFPLRQPPGHISINFVGPPSPVLKPPLPYQFNYVPPPGVPLINGYIGQSVIIPKISLSTVTVSTFVGAPVFLY